MKKTSCAELAGRGFTNGFSAKKNFGTFEKPKIEKMESGHWDRDSPW